VSGARGRKARPAVTSARRVAQAELELPAREPQEEPAQGPALAALPLTPAYLEALGSAQEAATGVSRRAWAKGSARGAGPQQQTGGVVVTAGKLVRCQDCGGLRRPGGVHGFRLAPVPLAADWPRCEHGFPWFANCRARPALAPPCCRGTP